MASAPTKSRASSKPAAKKTTAKAKIKAPIVVDPAPDVEALRAALEGFSWEGSSLRVGSAVKLDRIRRKNLSASAASKIAQCPASFAAESVLPRTLSPLSPAELGTGAHSVLEALYELPPAERTREALLAQVPVVTAEQLEAYADSDGYDELYAEVAKTVEEFALGIFKLEDPATVDVFKTEWDIRDVLLSNGVPFRGFLDRTIRLEPGNDDVLGIDDYKFGGKVKKPSPMFGDQYGDQLRLYVDAVERLTGHRPAAARLLWPRQGQITDADISPEAVKSTLVGFKRSWEQMNVYSDTGAFPTKPGNLCAWCPLANACPVAKIQSVKAKDQALTQPSKVDLGIPEIPAKKRGRVEAPEAAPRITDGEATPADTTETKKDTMPVAYPNNKWAAIAATRLADVAATHLNIHGQTLSPSSIRALSRTLGRIVERTTRETFGTFDWSHDAASRAAYAVESSIKSRPAPFGGTADEWAAWVNTVVGLSKAKLTAGVELVDVDVFGDDEFAYLVDSTVPSIRAEADAVAA